MAKKVILGAQEPTISSVKVFVGQAEDGELRKLADYSEKSIQGQVTDPFKQEDYDMGFGVEMDVDELAQSMAYLREQTNGRITATDVIKSMLTKSNDILDDEVINIAIECLKASRLRIDDGCIDHLCKGLEGLLAEYKMYF